MAQDRAIEVINFVRAARPWTIPQTRSWLETKGDEIYVKLYNRALAWAKQQSVSAAEAFDEVVGDEPDDFVIKQARLAALPGPKADELIAENIKKAGLSRKRRGVKEAIDNLPKRHKK